MPKLTDTRETKTVQLATVEGGKAEVYTSLLAGDVDALNREGALSEQSPKVVKVAARAIKEWNLTDENEKTLPITEEHVGKLRINDLTEVVNTALADFLPAGRTGTNEQK